MRVTATGEVYARASAHHGYAGMLQWPNLNELPFEPTLHSPYGKRRWTRRRTGAWTPATGWTRVSRGSHAGHLVSGPGAERRTEADGLVLVPIEAMGSHETAGDFAVKPPWRKPVYSDPLRTDT